MRIRKILVATMMVAMVLGMSTVSYAAEVAEYPLEGKLDELGLGFTTKVYSYDGYDWATDTNYGPHYADYFTWDSAYIQNGYAVVMDKCIEEGTLKYYGVSSDIEDMIAVATLANLPITREEGGNGLYFAYATDEDFERGYAIADNVRAFLATFENGWENASDYEKAVHICKWIRLAEYEEMPQYSGVYSCLVTKESECSGYTVTAQFLAHIVGIECYGANNVANHSYPVFNIDGVWLSCDPTASLRSTLTFKVYDVYDKMPEECSYSTIYDYMLSKNYENPTDLRDYFSADIVTSTYGGYYGLLMRDPCGHFPHSAFEDYDG